MSHSKTRLDEVFDRRDFLKTGAAAAVGSTAGGSGVVAAAAETAADPKQIATRPFGKTGRELPILGFGGAALPKVWGNTLSTEDRVKLVQYAYDQGLRYFDTAGNYMESQPILGEALKDIRHDVFLVSKVETTVPSRVAASVEKCLEQLQTDYLDAVLIHGTPGIENMSVAQAMKIHGELVKLRDQNVVRFIGLSAHSYFDKALGLISSGGFDLCMLSYGYLARGYNQVLSDKMVGLRNSCVAKADELGMGIVAMKVVAAGILGAWSGSVVPEFDKQRLKQLPGAAIRYVLDDERVHILNIGMRLPEEIDANIKTLSGDVAYTDDDETLLADYCPRALASDPIKAMKVE